MFLDPQVVTVNTVDQTLPTISREPMKSVYREDNGEYELVISHQENRTRNRRTVRLNRVKTAPDPFIPAQNVEVSHSVYLVIDAPIAGFSNNELEDDILGFLAWASVEPRMLKVLGGES